MSCSPRCWSRHLQNPESRTRVRFSPRPDSPGTTPRDCWGTLCRRQRSEQVDRPAVRIVDNGIAHTPEGVPWLEVALVTGVCEFTPGGIDLGRALTGEGEIGSVPPSRRG